MSEHNTQEFKNGDVSVVAEKKPDCLIHLSVNASPVFTKKIYNKAAKEIRKKISLPGFRKGRVPENILMQKYGKEIEKEFYENATSEALNEAIKLVDAYPFNRNERVKVDVKSFSKDEGGSFIAEYETYPDVPDIDPKSLKIKEAIPDPINEDLIDQNVDFFRLQHANLTEVKDRTAQEGDAVDIEIARMDQDEGPTKTPRVILSKDKIEKWIYDHIVGCSIGDVRENISPDAPKNSEEDSYKVKITLHKILEGEIPEADDELAKKVGYDTIAELRNKIKEQIEQVIKEEVQKAHCVEIENTLIEKYHFDIPASVKSREKQNRLQTKKEQLKEDEKKDNDRLQHLETEAEKEAEAALRIQFMFSKIIGSENLSVSEQEVAQQLTSYMMKNPGNIPDKEHMKEFLSYLREQALIQKLFNFLLANVQFVNDDS